MIGIFKAHARRQAHQNRFRPATGLQPEQGAAIVDKVELHVAAPPIKLKLALAFAIGGVLAALDNWYISIQEALPHRLHEGKAALETAIAKIVVKQAADASRFSAMLEIEILIAPTLVALVYIRAIGCTHVTRDGVVVAFHDDRLDRVTDRAGAIAALDYAEVARADAGYPFTPDGGATHPFRGRGVAVPRLDELMTSWPDVRVNIDPKADGSVPALIELLDRLDAWERVCIGSFSDARLRHIRALRGRRACTSMGPRAVGLARVASLAGRMPRLGADCVQIPRRRGAVRLVDAGFLRAAHRAGLPVHVWTINDADEMRELLALGVDGLMTDRPAVLWEVMGS